MSSMAKCFNARSAALAAGVALFGGIGAAQATIVYATNFNSPTYSDGGLIGQDGWAITGVSVVSPIAVANTGTNGNVRLVTTGQDVNHTFAALTSGSVYLTATITLSAAQATGDYFLHLGDGGISNFYARIFARSSGGGFQMAMASGSGTPAPNYGGTILSFGTTYTILARYDMVAGLANDTGALFINPTDPFGIGDTAYVGMTNTVGLEPTSISSVNLRQGTAANAATLVIDDINVSIIPTPGAAALLGLGGLMASRRRRA